MKLWRFEGTAEEFSAVAPALMGTAATTVTTAPEEATIGKIQSDDEETRFVTSDEARHILTRLELSENMQNMLRVLYQAHGRVLSEVIREKILLSSDQFRGMTGAFGRRVLHSVPDNVLFFDARWEPDQGQFSWLLPDSVKAVLKEDGRY